MNPEEHLSCARCKAKASTIFSGICREEMEYLDSKKECRLYKKGEYLFNEGTAPRGLFCVQKGKIKIVQTGADGKEQITHLIHDGHVMGHRAILGNDVYSGSAIAMEDSHVCFIPRTTFYQMVESNAPLALRLAHLLAAELKEAEQKITHIAQRPVKDRLAQALLSLIENYGMKEDQVTINVTIKRDDLANLAGTTRETTTRILYELQMDSIIELSGKQIRILNSKKLRSIAHTS